MWTIRDPSGTPSPSQVDWAPKSWGSSLAFGCNAALKPTSDDVGIGHHFELAIALSARQTENGELFKI